MSTAIRTEITNTIIEALTTGGLPPWRKPWSSDPNAPGLHTSLSSGKPYRGINQLLCMVSAMKNDFRSKWWATFNQIKQLGGSVLKGSKSTTVVLYRPVERTKIDASGKEVDDSFFVMRSFRIFNADQTTLEQFQVADESEAGVPFERYEHADAVIDAVGADIRFGGSEAFYHTKEDYIQLPPQSRFESPESFYETNFHEHLHYTESRLDWDRDTEGYAKGELRAEIGACLIMAELGLPITQNLENHAAYLQHWLKQLREDPNYIFLVSSQANKAVDYLLSFSRQLAEQPEPVAAI